MRVLVADDQAAVRSAVRRLLKEEPGHSVVGEVVRAEDLLDKARDTRPDLVLLDWELPGLASNSHHPAPQVKCGLLRVLHALQFHPKVIVLSGRLGARKVALNAGADAFVSKGDPPERLLTTLRTIYKNSGGDLIHVDETVGVTQPKAVE